METKSRYEAMAYGPIGKEVIASQPFTEADPIGVHAAILALFSAALNGHVVQPGDRPIVCWTCLVGRSSIGCKGTALEAAEHILDSALSDFLKVHFRKGITSGPSLINALHEQHESSLATEGGPDGRIIVIEDEWQNQLRRTRTCPTFSGVFRTVWDGKTVVNTTKGRKPGEGEQRVDEPLMGFHSHIQPGAWAKYISSTEALGGSYNRILPVKVHMSKVLPPVEGEERHIKAYQPGKALKLAYDWARKEKRVMTLSPAARRRFHQIRVDYLEEIAELPELLASFIERSAEQVWRVAAVLTAANRKTVIPADAVDAAKAFVDFSIESVKQLQSETASAPGRSVLTLEEKIRRALTNHGELTRSRLYQVLGGGRYHPDVIYAECMAMPDVEVVKDEREGSGARAVKYRLIEHQDEPEEMGESKPAPKPEDAAALLTAYAEWAEQEGNKGKSVSDFLAALQSPKVPAPRKTAAKRATTPRKTAAAQSRGTAAKKTAAAKTPAKKTAAKKATSGQARKKTPVKATA